jgi:hypothetical protein
VYGLLSNLGEGVNKDNFVFVAQAIIFSWLIFVTCNTAQRATDEVRNIFKSVIFCDVRPFSPIVHRRFGGTYLIFSVENMQRNVQESRSKLPAKLHDIPEGNIVTC